MTTTLSADVIVEMTRDIWTALLSDEGGLTPGYPLHGDANPSHEMSATIEISGDWNGTCCLTCSESAARHAACVMFDMADDELTDAEISDAIGELINVVGGNIKGILSGNTELSLPTVHPQGSFNVPGHLELGYKVTFTWLDEPVIVTVWTNDPS